MYLLNKIYALLGITIVAVSSVVCPFIKVPLMGNWNLYQTDVMLFCITFGILSLLVMFFFIRKIQLFRMGAYLLLAWSILAFLGVYFKINNYFGLKLVDGMLAKTLHLKWGWLVFFIGVFVVLFSVRKVKEIQ